MDRAFEVVFCVIASAICIAAQPPAMPASDQEITVKELVINGANDLPRSQIEDTKTLVVDQRGTSEALMDRVRESLTAALKSECYLRPDIDLTLLSRRDASPDAGVMYATVQDGVRFQLRNFRVQWTQAASLKDIEQLLPLDAMRRGDCRGLDDVPSTVAEFYQKRGYSNVKVHPLIQADKARRQFDLTLYIDEGSR
jgi:outer membrane protein assembly factor BamA